MSRRLFTAGLLGATVLIAPAAADAKSQNYIDVQAGLGYSTNPLLTIGDNTGSAFGRFSVYGYHGWTTERSASSISAYVEDSAYFSHYNNKQVFALNGSTSYAASEKVRLTANLGLTGDLGGQLSTRFYGVPSGSVALDPTVPPATAVIDPNLYGLNRRQYTVSGSVGAAVTLSPREQLTTSFGAQHVFISGGNDLDFTSYDATVGYDRQISERLALGGRVIAQYADYTLGRSIFSVGPQATIRAQLSSQWVLTGALGFVHTTQNFGSLATLGTGSTGSFDLALDGSLCRDVPNERICALVSRRTQSSVIGGAPTTTTATANYYRRLNAKDSVQASASVSRSGGYRILGANQSSTYYTLAGSYDRILNDRLSAGVNVAFRKLSSFGADVKDDIGGSAYVRYRLGDLR